MQILSKILISCLLLLLSSCSSLPTLEIPVEHLDSAFYTLHTPYAHTFGVEVINNSLDDTMQVGKHKVPPHYTGDIFSLHDYYEKNYKLIFKSYKAKKGSIKLRYYY